MTCSHRGSGLPKLILAHRPIQPAVDDQTIRSKAVGRLVAPIATLRFKKYRQFRLNKKPRKPRQTGHEGWTQKPRVVGGHTSIIFRETRP